MRQVSWVQFAALAAFIYLKTKKQNGNRFAQVFVRSALVEQGVDWLCSCC